MDCTNDWKDKLSPMLTEPCRLNTNGIGRVIIELVYGEDERLISFIEKNRGVVKRRISVVPSLVVEVPYSLIPDLARSGQVKKIWIDTEVKTK